MARRRQGNEPELPKGKLSKESLRNAMTIFRYVLPNKWYLISGMFLLLISTSASLVFPAIFGEMANVANGTAKYGISLNQLMLFSAAVLVSQSLISFIRVLLFARVSEYSMADLRKSVYKKLVTLPITYFDDHRVGELTSRITADISRLYDIFSFVIAQFIRQLVLLIGGIIVIFIAAPRLTLIMLATFPFIIIVTIIIGRYIRKLSKNRQDQVAQTNVIVDETLSAIQVVKAYSNEWYEVNRYGSSIDKVVVVGLKLATARGAFITFVISILFGGIIFIVWQGARLVEAGDMVFGDLISFIFYTAFIGGAIGSLSGVYEQLITALGATERVREILNAVSEIEPEDDRKFKDQRLKGDIQFNSLQFSYPSRPDIQVLKGIQFNIPAGQKVALVGASGAGKSTLIQMLLRFYHPESGDILVDGKPIRDYNLTHYRSNLALVPQEVMLFGGTILENIAYGKEESTEEEVIEAAKQANAWEFIQTFPEQLKTVVGERGIKLSGGQRQRIAIARAILRDPAILLLDEATSSLDAESEKVVQEALDNLMQNRTSIIIAHRLATIRNVDCIYVLDNGKIIEQGTHDELAAIENGAYSNLAKLQFEQTM